MASLGTPDPQMQPDTTGAGAPTAQDPNNVPNPSQGGPTDGGPPQKPGLWHGILAGALHGLAGAGKGFMLTGSVPGAVTGAVNPTAADEAVQNRRDMTKAKLNEMQITAQFQSAQAAQAVAMAKVNTARAAEMPQEARDVHQSVQIAKAEHLQALGIVPVSISDDTHDSTVAALNQLGATQGSIPHLFTLEVGGQHLGYDLGQLSQSPQGLTLINNMREATGQPALTPQQWSQTPPAAKTQASENALKFYAPPAPASAQQAQGQYLQYKSTLDAYMKRPNPNPDVVKGLTDLTAKLKQMADGMKASDRSDKVADAYANAKAQKEGRTDADKDYYQNQLAQDDVTGWKPRPGAIMSEQQFNAANTKFTSGRLNTATSTEAGYQMFQDAYAAHLKGDDKTGASSMMALFAHMGTTTSGLKGMRQTQDIIHEHRDAIGIQDKAEVFAKKMTNGDALSENQWKEFGGLIANARALAWKNTINEAHSLGLPVTESMLPPDIRSAKQGTSTHKHSDLGFVPSKGN